MTARSRPIQPGADTPCRRIRERPRSSWVGRMALGDPQVVRREYHEGHTIAGHSQNIPSRSPGCRVDDAAKEIEDGSTRYARCWRSEGDRPFFRHSGPAATGFRRAISAGARPTRPGAWISWPTTGPISTPRRFTSARVQRIEARGPRHPGPCHDIQPATALALPTILAELKARGYKIVQVVPATPDRPATCGRQRRLGATTSQHGRPGRGSWRSGTTSAAPSLDAPSPENFGVTEGDRQGRGDGSVAGCALAESRQLFIPCGKRIAAHARGPGLHLLFGQARHLIRDAQRSQGRPAEFGDDVEVEPESRARPGFWACPNTGAVGGGGAGAASGRRHAAAAAAGGSSIDGHQADRQRHRRLTEAWTAIRLGLR